MNYLFGEKMAEKSLSKFSTLIYDVFALQQLTAEIGSHIL